MYWFWSVYSNVDIREEISGIFDKYSVRLTCTYIGVFFTRVIDVAARMATRNCSFAATLATAYLFTDP